MEKDTGENQQRHVHIYIYNSNAHEVRHLEAEEGLTRGRP